jgi:hypothetical protein
MIKIIITITALLVSLLSFSQDTGKDTQGEFNGLRCAGSVGICYVTPPDVNNKSTTMKNYTTYKKSENTIVIELDNNTLSIEDQKKFFGKEYSKITVNEQLTFIQDADYEFSFDALLYLDMDVRYKYLKKGEYPLEIINDKVQVTLSLSKD